MRHIRQALSFAALCLAAALPGQAQFLGQTSPANVNQQIFAAQTTAARSPQAPTGTQATICTPTNGNPCGIRNLGQSFHYLTYVANASCVFDLAIQASFDGTNFFNISSDANANNALLGAGNAAGGVFANGWFPQFAINLANISNCAGGISVFYSGTSSAANSAFGLFTQSTGVRQILLQNTSLNGATVNATIPTPFSSTGGKIYLICTVTCGAGVDQFSLQTSPSPPQALQLLGTYTAANTTGLQVFTIPALTAPYVQLVVNSGNFTTTNASMYYEFDAPGTPAATANLFREINSNATTQIRIGAGFLENIVVNAPGTTWTIQIFDSGSCSGTAVAGATAFTVPAAGSNLRYDAALSSGLCILTAGGAPAGSITVSYR
jgi:hypothetical protein